jgi:GGDEF domain-containing protein
MVNSCSISISMTSRSGQFGHATGDKLLVRRAAIDCARDTDLVAIGGDEFAVIATRNDT